MTGLLRMAVVYWMKVDENDTLKLLDASCGEGTRTGKLLCAVTTG
jgi:hypothetical protein